MIADTMSEPDRPGTAPTPSVATVARRARPIGWSPGTGTLVAAWIASAAIARLTGAAAVILLLAATLVGFVFEITLGWWASRSIAVRSIATARTTTAGEACEVLVRLDGLPRALGRVSIAESSSSTAIDAVARVAEGPRATPPNVIGLRVRFDTPGVHSTLTVRVDVTGPAGLIWWSRSATVGIEQLHVAPPAAGPMLDVETPHDTSDGPVGALRGDHRGEIDGVRPWRRGDATNSVHWPSSLRSDELIVHDRIASADTRWVIALEAPDGDAAAPGVGGAPDDGRAGRLRWSIEEGLRQGHAVAVRTADGTEHPVADDGAMVWSAMAAQRAADAAAHGSAGRGPTRLLNRQISLRPPTIEVAPTITSTARWAGAAAASAAIGMLVGALDWSSSTFAVVLVGIVAGAVVSMWVAARSGQRPLAMQVAIVAAILLAVGVIAVQAADVDGLLAALRGPLPSVLILLVVLHGFESVDRRTLRVHLGITFVLASYAAGLRIDATLGWWLAAWGLAFAASMIASARTDRGPAPRRDGSAVSPAAAGRVLLIGAALAVCTLAVLSIVPIPDGPARLGLPALSVDAPTVDSPGGLAAPDGSTVPPSSGDGAAPDRGTIGNVVGYPGFTERLDTSVRGDLGDDIVMRVRAPEPAFWRGQTFTEFDGRSWTVSSEPGTRRDGPVVDVPPTIGDAVGSSIPSRELVQTYFVEQDLPNLVFAAARPVEVIFDGALWTRPDGALRADVTLTEGSVYTVVSDRVLVDAATLRGQGDLGEFFARFRSASGDAMVDPFLEVPASTTSRTIELATSLRTPGESTYDTILAYQSWLAANTEYDLDSPVPPDGADAVDDYLFESRRGFCEQIASALTIMLRTQGVPARLATGYVPGERDRVSGVWNVRARDAHAWVEVWFPQTGWQAFDPTADVPLAADAGGGTVGGDLVAAVASSISSFRLEIALFALAGSAMWILVRVVMTARHRRRRGRWGLLQDRFRTLGDAVALDQRAVPTNQQIAVSVDAAGRRDDARAIADELDRAAFDPEWIDDDDRYERTRAAVATLERSLR